MLTDSYKCSDLVSSVKQPLPLRYIKVVPLAAHRPNYNFSIWHIALKGVSDKALISQVAQEYDEVRTCRDELGDPKFGFRD